MSQTGQSKEGQEPEVIPVSSIEEAAIIVALARGHRGAAVDIDLETGKITPQPTRRPVRLPREVVIQTFLPED